MILGHEVSAFREAALAYCAVVDGVEAADREGFVDRVALSLSALYRLALTLEHPTVDSESVAANDLANDEAGELVQRVQRALGDWVLYWDVQDPTEHPPAQPVAGSLADDIADVYGDLRRGLLLWQQDQPAEALWEWRFSFWTHWGAHAADALRAIYWRRRSERDA